MYKIYLQWARLKLILKIRSKHIKLYNMDGSHFNKSYLSPMRGKGYIFKTKTAEKNLYIGLYPWISILNIKKYILLPKLMNQVNALLNKS